LETKRKRTFFIISNMASAKIKIGHYILGETLGVGTFGKVKIATHEITGHRVGVKILNRKKIASMDMAHKVRREIQFLKLFRHPHIIKLYEVITTPTDIFMIMEYVSGGELFDFIVKNGRLSEADARHYFQQIICAVEYCHRHKIVHRDLKPENLLLDESKRNVKIADFGLSNIMEDGEFLKTSCGSPNYAAPEVISGNLYAGAEVDVWSCGVILFALLCGRLPFDDEYIPSLFKKIKGGIFTVPSWVSPAARDLLYAMLAVDPLKRIGIQEIRENEWFNIDLPPYLKPLPDTSEDIYEKPNDSVVTDLSNKFLMDKEFILQALKDSQDNDIKVAYSLVLDQQRIMEAHGCEMATSPPVSTGMDIRGAKKRNDDNQDSNDVFSPSSISMLSTSITGGLDLNDEMSRQDRKKIKRSKWHLGIRSRSEPADIMGEVFAALKNLKMDWKIVDSPFHIKVRYHHPLGRKVLVSLQLYKVDEKNYLLDFVNCDNKNGIATFDFFTVCSKLITELAISG